VRFDVQERGCENETGGRRLTWPRRAGSLWSTPASVCGGGHGRVAVSFIAGV